ncbi:MAG: B12-binding domain-containing radical SAM protein [Bacteriovoracaceae bacterium]|nr:B12-binding domain-containing radical SAM protein [Bacteriovoracaceae bacterium]
MDTVLLVNCYISSFGVREEYFGKLGQLGQYYLAASLKQIGIEASTISVSNLYFDYSIINERKVKVIGFYTNSDNVHNVLKFSQCIKVMFPDVKIVLGGPHASVDSFELISNWFIDYVVAGDGEDAICEIAQQEILQNPKDTFTNTYFKSNGEIIPGNLGHDYDLSKAPKLDYDLYSKFCPEESAASLITSRGCPYRCIFCSEGRSESRYRELSAARIYEDVCELVKNGGVKSILFVDDCFVANTQRLKDFCHLVINDSELKDNFVWFCEGRVDIFSSDRTIMPLMIKAGLVRLQIGIESGDPEILSRLNKSISIEDVEETVTQAVEFGLESLFSNFIIGCPGDSPESIQRSIDLMTKLIVMAPGIFEATCCFMSPYLGTELAENLKSYKMQPLDLEFLSASSNDSVFVLPEGMSRASLMDWKGTFYLARKDAMNKVLPHLPASIVIKQLCGTRLNMLTEWSNVLRKNKILSNWSDSQRHKSSVLSFGSTDIESIIPLKTFTEIDVIDSVVPIPSIDKYYSLSSDELFILSLCSGKLSIREIADLYISEKCSMHSSNDAELAVTEFLNSALNSYLISAHQI